MMIRMNHPNHLSCFKCLIGFLGPRLQHHKTLHKLCWFAWPTTPNIIQIVWVVLAYAFKHDKARNGVLGPRLTTHATFNGCLGP